MSKLYGLPFKGSKGKIAPQIFSLFPRRKHFYDLFMGGGAMTHFAMQSHRFEDVTANDINWMCPALFRNVLEGKYKEENRWISREDFNELKDKDPFVAFVWSFGNNLRDYIYGKDVEPIKKALHYVLFFQDDTYARELGYDLTEICNIKSENARYRALRHWLGGGTNGRTPTCREIPQNRNIQHYSSLQRCKSNTIHVFKGSKQLGGGKVNLFNKDYQEIDIKADSVIYADIPYHSTNVYDTENPFDYDRFYKWALRQTEPLFISEYWMPESDFKCIKEIKHTSLMCATSNHTITERVFIPRTQENKTIRQLELF